MAANNSTTGGALLPSVTPAPLEADALDNFLHDYIVSLTGFDNTLVRPRWQPAPANIPSYGSDWVAFGIMNFNRETFANEEHIASSTVYNVIKVHEEIDILASFYGPNSASFASVLRDGMQVAQNREILVLNGMNLVESKAIVPMPELVKERWLKRYDLHFTIRRIIVRKYAVESLASAEIDLHNELYVEVINVP